MNRTVLLNIWGESGDFQAGGVSAYLPMRVRRSWVKNVKMAASVVSSKFAHFSTITRYLRKPTAYQHLALIALPNCKVLTKSIFWGLPRFFEFVWSMLTFALKAFCFQKWLTLVLYWPLRLKLLNNLKLWCFISYGIGRTKLQDVLLIRITSLVVSNWWIMKI